MKNSVMETTKALVITLMIGANVIGPVVLAPAAMASETTYGVLNLSGNVPEIFQLDVRGVSGDIDLNGGSGAAATAVTNRVLGIFHLKININMASFKLSTTNTSGSFATAPAALTGYPFSVPFSVNVLAAGCTTLDPTVITAVGTGLNQLGAAGGGADMKLAAGQPATVGQGVEEDCQLVGSWTNQNVVIPLAGVYKLPIVATMISV